MSKIEKKFFGKTKNNEDVFLFTLSNTCGNSVDIINLGATIVSIKIKAKNDDIIDVALGYSDVISYMEQNKYMGAVIGRNANRIEGSILNINGKEYKLNANEGENQLHGGVAGFDKKLWSYEYLNTKLVFSYTSPNGEEGYSGNLMTYVSYEFTDDNKLIINYSAYCDKDTVVNLTNHTYFNLDGHNSGDILNHYLKIFADKFTENNNKAIPTGVITNVEDTPFDFRTYKQIGKDIDNKHIQLKYGKGYDLNYIINGEKDKLKFAACAYSEKSGIHINTYTTLPGIQLYTGNYIAGCPLGKEDTIYKDRSGFCLETQFFPNANKHKHFPDTILKKGEKYNHITIYEFYLDNV